MFERNAFQVQLENFFALYQVGVIDQNMPIESSWTQQSFIQDVRSVSGRKHDYVFFSGHPVHFHQELIQGLFTFPARSST